MPPDGCCFNMLGAISQFETELRAERQMDGIAKAKARGVPFGRRLKTLKAQQIADMQTKRQQGTTDVPNPDEGIWRLQSDGLSLPSGFHDLMNDGLSSSLLPFARVGNGAVQAVCCRLVTAGFSVVRQPRPTSHLLAVVNGQNTRNFNISVRLTPAAIAPPLTSKL